MICDLVGSELSTFSHEIPSKSQPPLNFIKPQFSLAIPVKSHVFPEKKKQPYPIGKHHLLPGWKFGRTLASGGNPLEKWKEMLG